MEKSFNTQFLGVNATVEGISPSKRWSHVTSYRQKDNQFCCTLDTESDYMPRFKDFQTLNTCILTLK